jgi:predicted peptidase
MLMNFTNYLLSAYSVDKNRVYLTGLSMGGQGTWSFGTAHPDIFAALLPICGRTEPEKAEALKEMPIWVFHGAKDDVISIKYSEDMVNALKKYDAPIKFTIYPEAGHDSWTQTYSNQEVYDWLMKQSRKEK